jgi:hypothetical protein
MKITNTTGLPEVIRRAAEAFEYSGPKWQEWPKVISNTTLIGPPRIAALKRMHDGEITQDIKDMMYALEGSALHAILERGRAPGGLYEFRVEKEYQGSIVSAQLDVWEAGVLYDYKWTLSKPKAEWEQQLNVEVELLESINVQTREIKVVAFRRGYVDVIPQRLWSASERDAFITKRVELHQLADMDLPQCSDEETWGGRRCPKYCMVGRDTRFCTQWLDKKGDR